MQEGQWRRLLLVTLLLALVPAERALAVNPETLLMPGKLSTAHAKYEEQCTNCHDRANSGRQTQLCLDCHKDIAADVAGQRGYHGHVPGMAGTQCHACHTEHLGRAADIVKLVPERFNHDLTDYRLRGAHADVACASCHAAGKHYRDAPRDCLGCHKKE
ncbi:MAG TPA: cytochrome c3 family protein [Candidatus Dormibacteraeota bacterium]|nr:cytochrome c3 family protein [Candidatus Dormibacteraeota bacterium]